MLLATGTRGTVAWTETVSPRDHDLPVAWRCSAFVIHDLCRGLFSVRRTAAATASAAYVASLAITAVAICAARAPAATTVVAATAAAWRANPLATACAATPRLPR